MDHTPVDVIVVDNERRLSIGRPWLTSAIDVASRMVACFHVSLSGLHPHSPFPSPFRMQSCRRPSGWLTGNCKTSTGRSTTDKRLVEISITTASDGCLKLAHPH